jgi:hypothetical protein
MAQLYPRRGPGRGTKNTTCFQMVFFIVGLTGFEPATT